jgi:hypothetical protein
MKPAYPAEFSRELEAPQQHANGWVFVRLACISVQGFETKIQLAQVLGFETIHLQLDREQTVQAAMKNTKSSAKSRPPTCTGNFEPTKQKSRPSSIKKLRNWPADRGGGRLRCGRQPADSETRQRRHP